MKTIVFAYGNVGKAAVDTLLRSPDFELCGVVDPALAGGNAQGLPIVAAIEELPKAQAAILAVPSRLVPDLAEKLLEEGISTADAFDIHTQLPQVQKRLDAAAKRGGAAAVTAAGWDPGTDSVVRCLLEAMAPAGITYTDFGPGMSMGHSVAAKAIAGVKDALSLTVPMGTSLHRRMVYIELEEGYDLGEVTEAILADAYFSHDESHVIVVPSVNALKDMGHGVRISRKGVSGTAHNQQMEFSMKINNPALTAQVLVSSLRAALRQKPGCYTMIEVPPADLLPCTREEAVRRLV